MANSKDMRIASRYIPKGSRAVRCKVSGAVVYLYERNGRACLIGYLATAGKAAINYSYRDEAKRDRGAAEFLAGAAASFKARAEREAAKRAALAKPHNLKVGDVLSGSWGYDQTNYEWWQVVALKGARMVEIRKIASEAIETGFMSGRCVPLVGQFRSDEPAKRVMVSENDTVRLYKFCSLSKAEQVEVAGKPAGYRAGMWSSYA